MGRAPPQWSDLWTSDSVYWLAVNSCETLSSGSPGVNETGREHDRMEGAPSRIRLCSVADVASGTALKVETDGLAVAVFNLDGTFYVTDDACTHGPGSLSEGEIFDDIIECNFHQGQFCIRTGEPVLAPCTEPVKTYLASVRDGRVVIEV